MKSLELKILPLVVVAIAASLMWLASMAISSLVFDIPANVVLAIGLSIIGVAIVLWAALAFRVASTTLNPVTPQNTSSLVTAGIFRFSRNPMYLGFFIFLLAWAVWLSNIIAFLFLPAFVLYMNRFQITPEERILLQKFGGEFQQYMTSVRRWI